MTTQWSTRTIGAGGSGGLPGFDPKVLDEDVVILMQGRNTFGDRIYSYLKITLKDLMRMQSAVQTGQPFNPSDFGSVVAAGKGDPSEEVRAEISSLYRIIDPSRAAASAQPAAPVQPKAWDDY